MNIKTAEYIKQNRVCGENIFRNWREFLNVLYENGDRADIIVWFDYCKVTEQHKSLGGGGYRDTQNPEYMWAETQIFENGFGDKSLEEILEYIESVRNEHREYDLYPSFYIKE